MRTNIPKTKDLNVCPERELPFTGNAAFLPYEEGMFTSKYDKAANEMREKILNLPDTAPATERVYYISYKGDNKNDGRSPEKPWKDFYRIGEVIPNSTVLFERGGVYRGRFTAKSNMFYGAYGEGPKPQILGSKQNYSVPEMWQDEGDNIWSITYENSQDVGAIIFDHGVVSAIRSFGLENLDSDYKYYYDTEAKKTYIYFSKGNPALYHAVIEITDLAFAPCIIKIEDGSSNITVENLCMKYANFGASVGGHCSNLTFRGCEIGFIGGCQRNKLRWGNGIEFWGSSVKLTVENCWVYQCYDAGITNQCTSNPNCPDIFEDVYFINNLLEFNQYNIEFFNSRTEGSYCKNMYYNDNILRFAGYQVFDPKLRPGWGSDSSYTAHFTLPWNDLVYENFYIENNILDTSYGYLIKSLGFYNQININVQNNCYLQQAQKPTYYSTEEDAYPIRPAVSRIALYTKCQEDMEKGIGFIDPSAKSVKFE